MNNDSTSNDLPSSEPAPAPASASDPIPGASEGTTGAAVVNDTSEAAAALISQDAQPESPAKKRALAQTKKKFEFINNLTLHLDILIYVELCILYYMDCSLFRLLLRAVNQMMFLSPKPQFIPAAPIHRPYIGAIFGPNIICILLHILTARSEAGEAMRGYLHGGVIIDLIGQKGPTSKFHLVLLDLLVLGLQCFMLAVHVERERLIAVKDALSSTVPTAGTDVPREAVVSAQNLDAEERGQRGDAIVTSEGDMEMQPMMPQNDGPSSLRNEVDDERNEERERLLAEPPAPQEDDDDGTLDILWSGSAIVADFHVMHTLRRQWLDYGNATESAIQTVGFSAELAAVTASRRMNAAGARFQRDVGSLTN